MKALLVGDPHIRVEDTDEGDRLIEFICLQARARKIKHVIFLGDLFHTHAVVRLEVQDFWLRSFDRLNAQGLTSIVLVGNHDIPANGDTSIHALQSLKGRSEVTIVDAPMVIDGVLYLPYIHENEKFVEVCHKHQDIKTVICHVEMNGSQYENGSFSKHGVLPEVIPQTQVISGHIHMQQAYDKVFYAGSPRWLTSGDANQVRGIWAIDGLDKDFEHISTEDVCTKILLFEDRESAPVDPPTDISGSKVFVEIYGSSAWIEARRKLWSGLARIRPFCTDAKIANVRESEGVSTAFKKYFAAWTPPKATDKTLLESMISKRLPGFRWS